MNIAVSGIEVGRSTPPTLKTIQRAVLALTHRRLSEVFEAAKRVFYDDHSRIVFFSDCHRGDNGRVDAFARNRELFFGALNYYYREAFTYIEVGDGDDLWQNRRFSDVRRAHGKVFDLLHRFNLQDRLHLVVGNHDLQGRQRDRVEKDGLVAHEGLVLQHAKTGQRVFVVHGHQADLSSDGLHILSRLVVRYIWKRLQLLGLARAKVPTEQTRSQRTIEQRIVEWVQARRQIVVCGHTHRPACPTHDDPPYFNTGSCLHPGTITGLEVLEGAIALVRWSIGAGAGPGSAPTLRRELLTIPCPLGAFG
jgi:UDP-2,3-diacylglucosamine pyrophosphatase LpxH